MGFKDQFLLEMRQCDVDKSEGIWNTTLARLQCCVLIQLANTVFYTTSNWDYKCRGGGSHLTSQQHQHGCASGLLLTLLLPISQRTWISMMKRVIPQFELNPEGQDSTWLHLTNYTSIAGIAWQCVPIVVANENAMTTQDILKPRHLSARL